MDHLTPGGLPPTTWTLLSSMDLLGCPGLPVFALGLFLHFPPFPSLVPQAPIDITFSVRFSLTLPPKMNSLVHLRPVVFILLLTVLLHSWLYHCGVSF